MVKPLAPSLVTHKDPKGLKFLSIVEATYDKAGLSEEDAQCVNDNDTTELSELIAGFIDRNRGDWWGRQEVESSYAYPPEYTGPKPIEEQIAAIAMIFDLDPAQALGFAKSLPELPDGAEGWFAIPTADALAKQQLAGENRCPKRSTRARRYCRGVRLVFEKLAATRPHYRFHQASSWAGSYGITRGHLRQSAKTAAALDRISEAQPGDILIVAAQLGLRHRGRSARRVRGIMSDTEYGLGTIAIFAILLTHPERLVRWEQLHVYLAGDEIAPVGDGTGCFVNVPTTDFCGDSVDFDSVSAFQACVSYGTPTGFLP